MEPITIREIHGAEAMAEQFPLLVQLSPKLDPESLGHMLADMVAKGYRMKGAFSGPRCIGVSGFWIATKIYSGKYVELDNVVIDSAHRNTGAGRMLCLDILEEARKEGCVMAMLDAYLENESAHRFYEREGFFKRGYHFLKPL